MWILIEAGLSYCRMMAKLLMHIILVSIFILKPGSKVFSPLSSLAPLKAVFLLMVFFLLSCRSHKQMWQCVYVRTCVCVCVWRVGGWLCVWETMGNSSHSEYGLFCVWFNLLQIDLPAKQEYFILCNRLKLHCAYVPQFLDPFIHRWTSGTFHILALMKWACSDLSVVLTQGMCRSGVHDSCHWSVLTFMRNLHTGSSSSGTSSTYMIPLLTSLSTLDVCFLFSVFVAVAFLMTAILSQMIWNQWERL